MMEQLKVMEEPESVPAKEEAKEPAKGGNSFLS
jgi:hypothetical protein